MRNQYFEVIIKILLQSGLMWQYVDEFSLNVGVKQIYTDSASALN